LSKPATIKSNSNVLEIRNVPTGLILYAAQQWTLCNKYAHKTGVGNNTNSFIKGISVWLILKAETTTGKIQNYRRQLLPLAEKCKMSIRTLDKYIAWLKQECLVDVDGKHLVLKSYRVLRQYGINIKERELPITYDTTNKTTMAEVIITLAINKMKENWMQVYWKKINQNQDEYKRLYDLLVYMGADASRLNDPEYFRECHLELMLQAYKEEKPGQPIYDFLHKYIDANPDLNCMAKTYANKMGYSAAMSFCHLKFRLKKRGLITVEKDHIESECRSRKDEKIFHHRWLKKTQNTIWFRVDQISINTDAVFGEKLARAAA
jgi:hypothetical protein